MTCIPADNVAARALRQFRILRVYASVRPPGLAPCERRSTVSTTLPCMACKPHALAGFPATTGKQPSERIPKFFRPNKSPRPRRDVDGPVTATRVLPAAPSERQRSPLESPAGRRGQRTALTTSRVDTLGRAPNTRATSPRRSREVPASSTHRTQGAVRVGAVLDAAVARR